MDYLPFETELQRRIDQSRQWLATNPDDAIDIRFRDYSWTARPIAFLDSPQRVERYGVGFELTLNNEVLAVKVRLNVRIQPKPNLEATFNLSPYVVIYAVDQNTHADDAITWVNIDSEHSLQQLAGLSIAQWHQHWLQWALNGRNTGKVFEPRMQVA